MCDSHNSIDSIGSIDCVDSIDSIESEDSTDFTDSIYRFYKFYNFYTRATQKTASIHTTHKGKMILPMGAAPKAPPPSVLSVPLCVWCGTCVLGSGTLYLNNMSVYCTYIHTTYDFCMDNCG